MAEVQKIVIACMAGRELDVSYPDQDKTKFYLMQKRES